MDGWRALGRRRNLPGRDAYQFHKPQHQHRLGARHREFRRHIAVNAGGAAGRFPHLAQRRAIVELERIEMDERGGRERFRRRPYRLHRHERKSSGGREVNGNARIGPKWEKDNFVCAKSGTSSLYPTYDEQYLSLRSRVIG